MCFSPSGELSSTPDFGRLNHAMVSFLAEQAHAYHRTLTTECGRCPAAVSLAVKRPQEIVGQRLEERIRHGELAFGDAESHLSRLPNERAHLGNRLVSFADNQGFPRLKLCQVAGK